jgi:uncharacterized protein (TIGR02646 family)
MISVSKPTTGPKRLEKRCKIETERNEREYNKYRHLYLAGTKNFKFKDGIYNSKEVKLLLREIQHQKCCFCEKSQADEHGAVEHFRPKGGHQSSGNAPFITPGYYWLCYEWSNLYFVCNACNGNKKNLFPLVREKKRALSHHDDVNEETPYLLRPDGPKNPRKHIVFDLYTPRALTKAGELTIAVCKLDRDALNQGRQKLLNTLKILIDLYESPPSPAITTANRAEIRDFLLNCQKADAEYSAAAIDYIRHRGIQLK